MIAQIIRRIVCTAILGIGLLNSLNGMALIPTEEIKAITAPVITAPPAAPVEPLIADVAKSTPKHQLPPAKSCPCSDQCTCGCNEGQPCKCSQRADTADQLPPSQNVTVASARQWTIGGRPWTRTSILSHLYGQDGNTNHNPAPQGSLDHLPTEELIAMHNADHEKAKANIAAPAAPRASIITPQRPVRTIVQPPVRRSVRSCPNGNCPLR